LMRGGAREIAGRGWSAMVVWVLRANHPSRLFYEQLGGRHLRGRDVEREIEGARVTEAAYVWDDLAQLASRA
ncbi:MAG TPA: hypothetical protein VM052_02005, partial [Candidatus Limnocylindrales bacterium]|nr:hypothetical protein [Candidatus Limnocylindrales bacterium]